MLLSLNKLALVILTVSAVISLAYSSSTSPTTPTASSTISGASNTSTQTSSLASSSNANATTNTPATSTLSTATTTPTSSNQSSTSSSSVVPNASTNSTVAPNSSTQSSNSTTVSSSNTTATTPTTTPAPVCLNQNCTGNFTNLSCLNPNGSTCVLGDGFCFQTVITSGSSSMVYTGCADKCEAITMTRGTNYTEEKRCCRKTQCNAVAISLPPGSSSTRATSCFWIMLIFVVCVFFS